jgi:hypothetical protein
MSLGTVTHPPEAWEPKEEQASLLPIDVTFGPLVLNLAIGIQRLERRQRCSACGKRRVCVVLSGGLMSSPPACARCAGIRR